MQSKIEHTESQNAFSTLESFAIAWGVLIAGICWLPFLFAQLFSLQGAGQMAATLLLVFLVFVIGTYRQQLTTKLLNAIRSSRHASWQDKLAKLFIFAQLILVIGLFYSSNLIEKDGGLWSTGIGCEDMAIHGTIANFFLNNPEKIASPSYPIFQGAVLGYPFLSDFSAAAAMAQGLTIGHSFFITAVIALLGVILAVTALARRFFSWLQSSFVLFFFLVGGNAGFIFLIRDLLAGDVSGVGYQDYTNNFNFGLHYHNILIAVLLPMRTSLFGLAVALPAVIIITSSTRLSRSITAILGILIGSLPLINSHALVAVCTVGLITIIRNPIPELKRGASALLLASCFVTPQILWVTRQLNASETPFIRFSNGYMFSSDLNFLPYWVINLGFFWFMAVFGFKGLPESARRIVLPLIALFPLSFFVYFQPNSYDNIKLMLFSHLGGAFLVVNFLQHRLTKRAGIGLKVILISGALASGMLAIHRETNAPCLMATPEERSFAQLALKQSSSAAVFLTSNKFNHPIPFLSGRQIYLGNHNWLSQHGISYAERKAMVRRIYNGGNDFLSLIKQSGVTHVVVGPYERDEFPELNEKNFEAISKEILQEGSTKLFVLDKSI